VRRLAAAALLFACGLSTRSGHADWPASQTLKGFRYVLKPGFTYQKSNSNVTPPVNQDATFAVSNHFGWAFPIGPIVLSPGGSLPVYFFDNGDDYTMGQHQPGATLAVLGELEVHLPLRYVSMYGIVGAGGAFYFGSNQRGGVFRGGGGVMLYPVSWIGIGFQAAYLAMSNAQRVPMNPPKPVQDDITALELTWPIELRF
jgi:hypothetical protein